MVSKETFAVNGQDTLKGMDAKEIIEFLLEQSRYALNEYRLDRDFTNVSYSCYVPYGIIHFDIIKTGGNGYRKGWIQLEFKYAEKNKLTEVILTPDKITKSSVHIEPEHFDKLFER